MISVLLPTRGRPRNIKRLHKSILATADNFRDIELIIAVDDDDKSMDKLLNSPPTNTTIFSCKRQVLSQYWNDCYKKANGDILMHCGDDIVFRTKGWDTKVKETFERFPDNIVFIFGNDGSPHNGKFGTHGFIHRKWAETVGYFVPPFFSSDYNDTWLNDVAKMIGRHVHIDILTEHMHPDLKKARLDKTHKERIERHQRDNVGQLYESKHNERVEDANKLREVIE
jgi:glycosyltransferase involved in cell wall biosynthesis